MKKVNIPPESGKVMINGHEMEWTMKRSKNESFFGVRGSRIFELTLKKDGKVSGVYEKGWTKRPEKEDDETSLCISFLVDKYGKSKFKKKKEMGSLE